MDTTRTAPASTTPARPRRHRVVAVGLLALAAGGMLVGCSSDDSSDEATTFKKPKTTQASSSDTSAPEADDAGSADDQDPTSTVVVVDGGGQSSSGGGQPSGGGQSSGGGQPTGGGQSGNPTPTNPPTTTPTTPPPVITSFSTPESIDCHNGDFQEFTAEWTTTNAVKVTISIDGPGVYDEYPANGSTSLPFSCSSSHSFLLTAYGADGQTATKSVTLEPRNVQAPAGPEDEGI